MNITKTAVLFISVFLLTAGAAFTSMAAAYEWYQEGDTWRCRGRDGADVTDEWVKSGQDMYRLDEKGELAVSGLIEAEEGLYFVDADGKMVKNDWRRLKNEDYPGECEDEYSWYYFTSNGKAQKARDNGKPVTINDKKYFFSEEGRMLHGWIDEDGRMSGEDYPYRTAMYYCGDEEDGVVRTGWNRIMVEDPDAEDVYDTDYWFFFNKNGQKFSARTDEVLAEKTINGSRYAFDEYGVMQAEWQPAASTSSAASASISSYYWFRDKETGARLKKGWFRVLPEKLVNEEDCNDETPHWYYASGGGKLAESCIKDIKGKRYAFNEKGEMLSGLVCLAMDPDPDHKNKIVAYDVIDTEAEAEKVRKGTYGKAPLLTDEGELDETGYTGLEFYFLGNEETDGSMKTGTVYLNIEGTKYTFCFGDKGSSKYKALHDFMYKNCYYIYGARVCADEDIKYQAFKAYDCSSETEVFAPITAATKAEDIKIKDAEANPVSWRDIKNDPTLGGTWNCSYILISDKGSVVKNGIKKDADGNRYKVTNYSAEAID